MTMDCHTVDALWRSITTLEAQELLINNQTAMWSSLKPKDREKLYKEIQKSAYNNEWNKQATASNAEIASMFGGL